MGCKGELLRAIQALYEGGKACVKVGQSETEMFDVQKGVKQGCTLSPWLFNVFVDEVVKEARRDFVSEVKLITRGVEVLMFTDDMVLMVESAKGLENNLGVMSEALRRWELKVNWKKTKVMRIARQKGACEVRIGHQELEQVDEMKYLGVVISANGSMEKEVEEGGLRIANTTRMIGGMSEVVLRRNELSKNAKVKVVNATMIPTLMYGCEAWSLSK